MVDPNVFEFVKHNGYDSKKVSGFAFGMGADRIAILKYGVDDIQLFFQGDVRFSEQLRPSGRAGRPPDSRQDAGATKFSFGAKS